jgi:mRNA interferase MazF
MPILHGYLAVPATRTVRGIPTEVALGREDGMPEQCVLSLDNMGVVHREFFAERICALGPDRLAEVCRALAVATGC